MTIATYGVGDVVRIGPRIQNAGTATDAGYYVAVSATGVWTIIRVDQGGSPVTLATGPTLAIANGNKIGIRIVGSVVTALSYSAANGWQKVLSYDDRRQARARV